MFYDGFTYSSCLSVDIGSFIKNNSSSTYVLNIDILTFERYKIDFPQKD